MIAGPGNDQKPDNGHDIEAYIVDHPAGERYDRAVVRIECHGAVDQAALSQRVRERLKANVLIQMDVELVPANEIPPSSDLVIDKRSK